jgi:hypothetical protein
MDVKFPSISPGTTKGNITILPRVAIHSLIAIAQQGASKCNELTAQNK